MHIKCPGISVIVLFLAALTPAQISIGNLSSWNTSGNRITFICANAQVRLTFNTHSMVRIQLSPDGTYRSDSHPDYFMVQKFDWEPVYFNTTDNSDHILIETDDFVMRAQKSPFRLKMYRDDNTTFIAGDDDAQGMYWNGTTHGVKRTEGAGSGGKFGFGCADHGRTEQLNFNGGYTSFAVTHGKTVVPFFMSTCGYGIFLNTVSPNTAVDASAGLSTADHLDYWFMYGPSFRKILDLYSELTGRMDLYGKWAYGFMLSKYGNDNATQAEFLQWIRRLRQENYPTDAYVFDYGWRGGKCNEHRWDPARFTDLPGMFAEARDSGFHVGLHNNMCTFSNWYGTDFTDQKSATDWVLAHMNNVIKPDHGDFFWPDEFDVVNDNLMANRSAKLVYDAWLDHTQQRRPMFMTRGGYANHHFATTWSGDLNNSIADMKYQIVSTQTVGLSGYVFWSNDLGGFMKKPTDALYTRWVAQFGAFNSIMRTHGHDGREPWLYGDNVQNTLRTYLKLRYRLFPYIYTTAWQGASQGIPMTRAMLLDHQDNPKAWNAKYQYMFGDWLLVAPALSESATNVAVWFPEGTWYDYFKGTRIDGDKDTTVRALLDEIPVFVKAGAIIPMGPEIAYADQKPLDTVTLDIYPPLHGLSEYTLYEDDGVTRNYLNHKSYCQTAFRCRVSGDDIEFNISAPACHDHSRYSLPATRVYICKFNHITDPGAIRKDYREIPEVPSYAGLASHPHGWFYDAVKKILSVKTTISGTESDITFTTSYDPSQLHAATGLADGKDRITVRHNGEMLNLGIQTAGSWSADLFDLQGRHLLKTSGVNSAQQLIPLKNASRSALVIAIRTEHGKYVRTIVPGKW